MNIVDIIIIILIVFAVWYGYGRSALIESSGLIGAFVGILLAGLIYEKLAFLTQSSTIRTIVMMAILAGTIFLSTDLMVVLGRYIENMRRAFRKFRLTMANKIVAGGVAGVGLVLAMVIFNAIFADILPDAAREQLKTSLILTSASGSLALPQSITNLATLRDPFGGPVVFSGEEAKASDGSSSLDTAYKELDAKTAKITPSIVKITTWGCGSIATGSGFIVDAHHVVTNAHVVAGGERISLADGDSTLATNVVYLDPKLDVAVLYVQSALSESPLTVSNDIAKVGSIGAHLGFAPSGFSIGDVVVTERLHASGYDIYHQTQVTRDIYVLRGDVIPGNSGGPVVSASGQVIGIILGHSTIQNKTGYAIVSQQITSLVKKAPALIDSVSTGNCAAS